MADDHPTLRSRAHTALSILISTLGLVLIVTANFVGLASVPSFLDFTRPSATGFPAINGVGVIVWFTSLILALAIYGRHRFPWVLFWLGVFEVVALQLDPTLMLAGMASIVALRPLNQWRTAAISGAVLALWVLLRNLFILDTSLISGMHGVELVALNIFFAVLFFAGAFGLGWLRRNKSSLDAADARADQAEQQAEGLAQRVNQQEERERLAREIHDALAHRLSLVSLHSGALEEAARTGDPATIEAAQVVRDNAHRSLEDLRDLIGALRNPPQQARPVQDPVQIPLYGMADVAEVIDSTASAGVLVNAFVMLCDPDEASELLNRAVFRLVQESLTNVVKHAPGSTVGIDLRASPKDGVTLRIRNQITRPWEMSATPGAGAGVIGMQERVSALNGEITVGPTGDGWFEVNVRLPWLASR